MSGSAARDLASSASPSASTTLPPLDMLERFPRRGSITDPSLHTSTPPPGQQQRRLDSDVSPRQKLGPSPHVAVRPASPYTFGSASATIAQEHSSNHLRRVLHSPEPSGARMNSLPSRSVSGTQDGTHRQDDERTPPRDYEMHESRPDFRSPSSSTTMRGPLDGPQFDYSMRRHSIATVQPSDPSRMPSPSDRITREPHRPQYGPGSGSLKRKMSHDRLIYSTVGEESGDGSAMLVDPQEPATKRRSSAFDTRIAQLSLYDRRDSNESRSPASTQPPWDRRDSSSSMFSMSSVGTTSSGFSAPDSHLKSMQSFSWNAVNAGGSSAESQSNEAADSSRTPDARGSSTPNDLPPPSSGDQRPMHSLPSMHPYADRRMSAPDATPRVMDRTLRSRSRPPSTRGVEAASSPKRSDMPDLPAIRAPQPHSEASPAPSETPSYAADSSTPTGSSLAPPGSQMAGTPYSRSPELRVSHKLAERKRRKEMKELFDELRDHLPADRGMKASKWEILSKAVDYIQQLKNNETALQREVEVMRHELDTLRAAGQYGGGIPGSSVGHSVVYAPGPAIAPYPPGAQVAGRGGGVLHNYGAGTPQVQATRGTTPM
ncbi:hypothetical protein EXIGLDRAFT_14015 [Exidia glandulosa HHB12029]|uniref:BHLH domain-containing protein n=1 Tax=Exidia glandulosa HHB12029 TaxID=1314781 RepID=A0A165QU27_EXIGL|nr:hypothetical protein EXIGLDRAFT_14015 [Exidia glandulosa HHB12029]